jgi:hypothetical protein
VRGPRLPVRKYLRANGERFPARKYLQASGERAVRRRHAPANPRLLGRIGWSASTAIAIAIISGLCAGSPAAAASSCPSTEASPGFRGFLPPCTAYEMVTPPYVGGGFVGGVKKSELPPISANGERLLGLAFSGFAETEELEQEGFEYGAIYEFARTPTGWSTEALDPPASLYPRRSFVFASADMSKSLWEVKTPPEAGQELPLVPPQGEQTNNSNTLVLREAAGGGRGDFKTIGPVVAPGHEPAGNRFEVVAASENLSHILIEVEGVDKQLWPGDQTDPGDDSLYEYDENSETATHEPVLVGVRNEGSVAEAAEKEGKPHVNEAAELISRCGTQAGGSYVGGVFNNSIAATGDVAYFTAVACGSEPQVNEVYARVNENKSFCTAAHTKEATATCTIKISEPSAENCGACASSESAPASAQFDGASEDGAKAFFTSEQALLEGAGGKSLYEYDLESGEQHLTLITPEVASSPAISADGSHVYFESTAVDTKLANANGETALPGARNLYVYDTETGDTAFVAREAVDVRASANGQFAVFESQRHLEGTGDSSAVDQLFEYGAQARAVARVSIGSAVSEECELTARVEARYACNGNTNDGEYVPRLPKSLNTKVQYAPTDASSALAVADGGAVIFESRDALTPDASAKGRNVYEYVNGEVFLISPGGEAAPFEREPGESRMLGIAQTSLFDGAPNNLFFSTSSQLIPQDVDTQENWYDAREDGGFPAPAASLGCGDACHGGASVAPQLASPEGAAAPEPAPPSPPPAPAKVEKSAAAIRAEDLAKALKACKKKPRKQVRACEKQARRRYGPSSKATKSSRRAGER